jgi:hypothetical protein
VDAVVVTLREADDGPDDDESDVEEDADDRRELGRALRGSASGDID